MSTIVNLTPHVVRVVRAAQSALEFPPSGQVARVGETARPVGALELGAATVALTGVTPGEIEGLPEPVPGTVYIVSAMVADAARRPDVVSPYGLVRGPDGQPIGCTGFRVWA